jgi:hypothetical protein
LRLSASAVDHGCDFWTQNYGLEASALALDMDMYAQTPPLVMNCRILCVPGKRDPHHNVPVTPLPGSAVSAMTRIPGQHAAQQCDASLLVSVDSQCCACTTCMSARKIKATPCVSRIRPRDVLFWKRVRSYPVMVLHPIWSRSQLPEFCGLQSYDVLESL